MALETATFIDALVTSNPDGADARSTADDHLRLIKAVLKRTFPLVGGAVSASHQALCYVNDLSASVQAQLNALRDGSETAKYALNATNAALAANASTLGGYGSADYPRLDAYNVYTRQYQIRRSASGGAYEYFQALDAPADNQSWIVNYVTPSGGLYYGTTGDSQTYGQAFMAVTRSGQTPTDVLFYGSGTVYFNGADLTNPTQLNSVPAGSYARLDNAQSFTKGTGSTVVANASKSTISPNMADGNVHRIVLGQSTTILAPTAPRSGQTLVLIIRQSTGGHYVSWNSIYKFPAGTDPTNSLGAGACDVFAFVYDDIYDAWVAAGLNVS
jgi:hypothetical protein